MQARSPTSHQLVVSPAVQVRSPTSLSCVAVSPALQVRSPARHPGCEPCLAGAFSSQPPCLVVQAFKRPLKGLRCVLQPASGMGVGLSSSALVYALLGNVCGAAGLLLGVWLCCSRSIMLLYTWLYYFLFGYWEPSLVSWRVLRGRMRQSPCADAHVLLPYPQQRSVA